MVVGGGFEGMVVVDEVKRENTVGEKGIRARSIMAKRGARMGERERYRKRGG